MKKKSIYIILIIASVSIIWGISYYREKHAYALVKEYYSVPPQKQLDSTLINDGENLAVDDYREQLILDLKKNNVLDKVILINPDEVGLDYYTNKNWFADPLHINQSGYDVFSGFLAQKISDLEK